MDERPQVYQPHNLTSSVTIPLLQAIITGVFVGLAAGALTAWLHLPFWGIGATAAAVAVLASWMSYRGHWQWVTERLLGVDLNNDGFIGTPEPPLAPMRIIVEQNQGHQVDYIDLPPGVDQEKMRLLASGLLGGRVFSQTAWTGNAGIFSRSEYDQIVNVFISRGLAAWKNPSAHAQGLTITAPGRAVLRRLATPTLPEGHQVRE